MWLKNLSSSIKKYFIKFFICFFSLLSLFLDGNLTYCNNLYLSNAILKSPNTTSHYRMIQFDVSWENSWRTSNEPYNWDAVWVFIKYRVGSGEWKHATLSTNSSEHVAPISSTITPSSDGKGVFIYRNANGSGTFSLTSIQLRWNYGTDGVSDVASVEVNVLGIEMVYIPQGSFYAGDNGSSDASLKQGSSDNDPWYIQSESMILVTNASTNGFYYVNGGNSGEDPTGSSFTIPSSFPKGYGAIYCMKYEISQGQYADFLNLLNSTQATNHYPNYNGTDRHTLSYNGGVYTAVRPDRACNFISWADGCAYADWSALRPMTELEYEKICRGPLATVSGEYAWGTTTMNAATTISGTEDGTESITNSGANCRNGGILNGGDRGEGPLRVGIFARSGTTREQSGAAYYGVMEMSGNLWERLITIGNSAGRQFAGLHGDGDLSTDGSSNIGNWPGSDAVGAGFRGGSYYYSTSYLQVSDRRRAADSYYNARYNNDGFRCVHTVESGSGGTVTDIDGNVYYTVTIGTQVWMVENLKTTKYRNGEAIPNVTDATSWNNLTTGAYCNYDNNSGNSTTFGRLYNWYAVNDSRNIAPYGWHVPTDAECTTLTTYLGGESVAGGKLKEAGTSHWISPNTGATNETGFTALPGGYRYNYGAFYGIGYNGYWWSSTEDDTLNAWYRYMYYADGHVIRSNISKISGFSVRCVRDN